MIQGWTGLPRDVNRLCEGTVWCASVSRGRRSDDTIPRRERCADSGQFRPQGTVAQLPDVEGNQRSRQLWFVLGETNIAHKKIICLFHIDRWFKTFKYRICVGDEENEQHELVFCDRQQQLWKQCLIESALHRMEKWTLTCQLRILWLAVLTAEMGTSAFPVVRVSRSCTNYGTNYRLE